MSQDRWRGKKRWLCHNRVTPLQALLGIEAILDSHHQRHESPNEREISKMLGLCRSAIETLRRAGIQQHTLQAYIKGTERPKK